MSYQFWSSTGPLLVVCVAAACFWVWCCKPRSQRKKPSLAELERRSLAMERDCGLVFEGPILKDGYDEPRSIEKWAMGQDGVLLPSGWKYERLGDRVCEKHASQRADYAAQAARIHERLEDYDRRIAALLDSR